MTDQPAQPPTASGDPTGPGDGSPPPPPAPRSGGQSSWGGGGSGAPVGSGEATSFFGALFDYSFNAFITPMIIKFVYVLVTVGVAIGYLVIAVATFRGSTSFGVLWLLVIGPIMAVLSLALARMTLEFYLAVVRVSEDVRRAVGDGERR